MKKNKESTSKQEPRKNSTAGSAVQEARNTQIQHQKKDQRKQPLTTTSAIQEGAKNMKKNKESTSNQEPRKNSTVASVVQEARNTQIQHQKKDQSKQPLSTTSAVQEVRMQQEKLEVRSTLMQHGKQEQRKKLFAIGSAVQVGRSTQTHHKKQDQMRQSLATGSEVEVGGSTYIPSQKDLDNHAFLVQPESSKKIDDQNDRFCPNNLKRQLRNTIGDHGQGSTEEQPASKKPKATSKCPAISLEKYINNHRDQLEEEELEDEESEENDIEQEVEGDINFENEEDEDTNDNTTEVHKRSINDRQEIILNKEGEPVGPDQKTVSQLSSFLGTIARSADLCPLTYTNWKAIPNKQHIWNYINQKYIIPEKGEKAVYGIINDAWRRYKCWIKKNHFTEYTTMRERLKNRPQDIPEAHFRVLMDYWRLETIQEISDQNAKNIAQQKWRHRAGPISFACIKERLSASNEDKESPTQAEMFIETRQRKKGKQLDQETNNAITKLRDLIENSSVPSTEAFKTVFGKEKPGRVRCYGRTTTPTLLKRNEEIAEIEKRHANEVKHLTDKVHEIEAKHEEMEVKHSKEMAVMEQKFQLLLRTMLNQNDSRVDMESLAALLSPCDANSGLRSSTSTHAPNNPKDPNMDGDHVDEDQMLDIEAEEDDAI
ncbi:uncharacterized protein LOC121969114 [Zingiber officinale]|uniref:uncharacterized protein LOC121969114 n=1 Tax=Zingiber officinale TaxID=94328 RepID=UPI001C4D1BF7|nr:uncharacterized protein LOC121969114 [Zingiber officinale]